MKRQVIVAAGLLGGMVGVIFGVMEKLERRVQALEDRPRSVPVAMSSDQSQEFRRNMQRESARDFVDVLREEGLVIRPVGRPITDSPQA